MLHKHEVDFIQHTLQCIERSGTDLSPNIKAKIERAQMLVNNFYYRKRAEQMGAYASAIGTRPSQGLMDSIAADCAHHGKCD